MLSFLCLPNEDNHLDPEKCLLRSEIWFSTDSSWSDLGKSSIELYFLMCRGFTLAGCPAPTKTTLSLLFPAGQGRENMMKVSWVEIRTKKDHSPSIVMGKTDLIRAG